MITQQEAESAIEALVKPVGIVAGTVNQNNKWVVTVSPSQNFVLGQPILQTKFGVDQNSGVISVEQ